MIIVNALADAPVGETVDFVIIIKVIRFWDFYIFNIYNIRGFVGDSKLVIECVKLFL